MTEFGAIIVVLTVWCLQIITAMYHDDTKFIILTVSRAALPYGSSVGNSPFREPSSVHHNAISYDTRTTSYSQYVKTMIRA